MNLFRLAVVLTCAIASAEEPQEPQLPQEPQEPEQMSPFIVKAERLNRPPTSFLGRLSALIDRLIPTDFLPVPNGQLVQNIVWRHKFLAEHPGEQAVIVTDFRRNGSLRSATTLYTLQGRVYAASDFYGQHVRMHSYSPADLNTRRGIRRIRNEIRLDRSTALMMSGSGEGNLKPLGLYIATAEETGDYSLMGEYAYRYVAGGPHEVLLRAYAALHDPDRSGLIPVSMGIVAVPLLYGKFDPPTELVTFEWEGYHLFFSGNTPIDAMVIPRNSLLHQPLLCVANADLLKSVYFAAAYEKAHSDEKAEVLNGTYPASVFTNRGTRRIYSPILGFIPVPAAAQRAGNADLAVMYDALTTRELAKLPSGARHSNAEPDELAGDDTDLQARRVYLSLCAVGIAAQLDDQHHVVTAMWKGQKITFTPKIASH